MFVNDFFIIASNPFVSAYIDSDVLGKLIFINLLLLSIISWGLIVYKFLQVERAKRNAIKFYKQLQTQKNNQNGILNIDYTLSQDEKKLNPFLYIYQFFKKQTLDLLNKNKDQTDVIFLSSSDISLIEAKLSSTISSEVNQLEKNLYILSTIVSLAPFLGLLGTVWGILTTFSEMQSMQVGGTQQMMLGGLSLALATTVIGLIDAIPAMIGYNYFKNTIYRFEVEMEGFSTEILSHVEMHYRKVEV